MNPDCVSSCQSAGVATDQPSEAVCTSQSDGTPCWPGENGPSWEVVVAPFPPLPVLLLLSFRLTSQAAIPAPTPRTINATSNAPTQRCVLRTRTGPGSTVDGPTVVAATGGSVWVASSGGSGAHAAVSDVSAPCTIAERRSRTCSSVMRCFGSFASSPSITGASGPARRQGVGGSLTIAVNVAIGVSRSNGGEPSTAAYNVAPSANRPDAGPSACPPRRSGDMYAGLPTMSPVRVIDESPAMEAIPKSV